MPVPLLAQSSLAQNSWRRLHPLTCLGVSCHGEIGLNATQIMQQARWFRLHRGLPRAYLPGWDTAASIQIPYSREGALLLSFRNPQP